MKNVASKELISIFLIRMSSAAAFAVFFSGLSLFLTKQKFFTVGMATTLTGLFLSLNYFLPLIGGVIAKYFNSYKKLYCTASIFSIAGCLVLANEKYLYLGLALVLINSLLANVCIKMFVTNLFNEDQIKERKAAFLWNYVGMNAGFLLGFFICGYYFIENNITTLFYIMSLLFFISLLLTLLFIKDNGKKIMLRQSVLLTAILLVASIAITFLLINARMTQEYLSTLSILLIFTISLYGCALTKNEEKTNFLKFIGYSLLNIFFWAVYMLTPIAFMQFIENGVDRVIGSYEIAPQWFINIDSIIILGFAPISALLIKKKNLNTLTYYAVAFLVSSLSLLTLLGGLFSASNFKISALSMLGCLVLLAIAELYISPTGDSLIGELVPKPLRPIMTGFLSLNMGVGVILSTYIANKLLIPYLESGMFGQNMIKIQQNIGCIAIILFLLAVILFLSKHLNLFRSNIKTTKRYTYE